MAAATNYHQLGSLKQQTFLLTQFWRPEPKVKVLASLGHTPSESSRENQSIFAFPPSGGGLPGVPQLVAAPSSAYLHLHILPFFSLSLPCVFYKDTCDWFQAYLDNAG